MCVSLLVEEGFAGYGLYWAILEVLRDAPRYRYSNNPKLWAYVLHCNDVDLVERILHRYGLFDLDDDGLVFSPWLLEQLENYDELKRKRSEAGRRGASRRWNTPAANDSKAMPLPSQDDSTPIAYNITQPNETKDNTTVPSGTGAEGWRDICLNPGPRVEPELLEALTKSSPEGHAPGYIAQVCIRYGMGSRVLDFLCEATNNAEVTNSTYKHFVALVSRVNREKWTPEKPTNFFLSKLFS